MSSIPYGLRGALRAAALALPLLASGCNTYILWQDARSSNHEGLEGPVRSYAWIGADGAVRGLVCEPSADARAKLHRLLPSSTTESWLLLEPVEYPETFWSLAYPREREVAALTWVEHADGSPAHLELVEWGIPWLTNRELEDLPARWRRYPSLYGPDLIFRLRCRARWIEAPPAEDLLATKLELRTAQRQVQDDDLGPVAKLALTPLTLVADLPFLPFQILGMSLWFP